MTQLNYVHTCQQVKHPQKFLSSHSGIFKWKKFRTVTPRLLFLQLATTPWEREGKKGDVRWIASEAREEEGVEDGRVDIRPIL